MIQHLLLLSRMLFSAVIAFSSWSLDCIYWSRCNVHPAGSPCIPLLKRHSMQLRPSVPHISSSDRQNLTVSGWRRKMERSQTNQAPQLSRMEMLHVQISECQCSLIFGWKYRGHWKDLYLACICASTIPHCIFVVRMCSVYSTPCAGCRIWVCTHSRTVCPPVSDRLTHRLHSTCHNSKHPLPTLTFWILYTAQHIVKRYV